MISDEDKEERHNTVKITGLKDNTYVTELSPIINLIHGKATIISERQFRSGTIRKDNIAFVNILKQDIPADIIKIECKFNTFYITSPEIPYCRFCGSPDHTHMHCIKSSHSRRITDQQ